MSARVREAAASVAYGVLTAAFLAVCHVLLVVVLCSCGGRP